MSERDQIPADDLLAIVEDSDLDRGPAASELGEDQSSRGLGREFREVLGLLPYALPAPRPRPELMLKLMAAVQDLEVSESDTSVEEEVVDSSILSAEHPQAEQHREQPESSERVPEPLPATVAPELSMTAPDQSEQEPPAALEFKPRSRGLWLPASLAAALVMSLLGTAFLAGRLDQQKQQLASLRGLQADMAIQESTLLAAHRDLAQVRDRLTMVTTIARRAYPLRTVAHTGSRRAASGIVYVCGNHQQWYLSLHGLDPPPPGKEYNLWFMTAEGTVNAGVLEVGADASVELEAPAMPLGTEGFAVSLEQRGDLVEPEGVMVLLGENSVSL